MTTTDPFARQAELLSQIQEAASRAPRSRRPSWAPPCDEEFLEQMDREPLTALNNLCMALNIKGRTRRARGSR